MTAISAYTQLEIQVNTKNEMLMFEHEDTQLHPREMKCMHIVQVLNMEQINRHHCLLQTLYQMYLKGKK